MLQRYASGRVENNDSDEDDDTDDEHDEESYSFPDLDAQIRAAIVSYGAVFPKLNFSAPKVRIYLHSTGNMIIIIVTAIGRVLDPPLLVPSKMHVPNGCVHTPQIFRLCVVRS